MTPSGIELILRLVTVILIESQTFSFIVHRWLAADVITQPLYVLPSYLARNLANVHKLIVSKITGISLSLKPVKASAVV
jgi:hypothetical protein